MVLRSDDTIAAIATPPGDGAIAVVRLSGRDALTIADRVFRGNGALADAAGFTAHLGRIMHPAGNILDQAVVTVFRSPHSYTGEHCVEIGCHGGSYLSSRVLEALLAAGARAAGPGEFTRRAFMNRKLDLTQAEAIADLVASRSELGRRVSMEQLQGKLGDEIRKLRQNLVDLCSLVELGLDFAEDGMDIVTNEEIKKKLDLEASKIQEMVKSYESGKLLREGASVAIIGKPNVGKSSLFNALLEHDRAIVTHIAGTTRDTLEESAVIDGIVFRLTDTAGIRESSDIVETEGVVRTIRSIEHADIILQVLDSEPNSVQNIPELDSLNASQRVVVVRNKSDLLPFSPPDLTAATPPVVHVSAKNGDGLDALRSTLVRLAGSSSAATEGGQIVTRQRHRAALQSALEKLIVAIAATGAGASGEFIALDLRGAADSLGEITGEVTTEEILNNVFSSFCIGK
jgi:tRNA modification GTPase